MSNVSYEQALTILRGWMGTAADKYDTWQETYNTLLPPPPPPPALVNDSSLAQYIADHYNGPSIEV
jgi:hypothetical protein